MRELPQVLVELRHLQSLYPLFAARPGLLAELEARGLLAPAAPNDTRLVPPAEAFAIAEFLHHRGEHHISARLAAAVDPGAGDGLNYFARSCMNLREVLASLMQHQADWLPGAHFQLQQQGGHAELRLVPREPGAPLGLLLFWEGTLTWIHRTLRDGLGRPLGITRASVMTPATPQSALLQELLGGPVQFEAPHFGLRWPAHLLDQPLPGSNAAVRARLAGCFEGIARRRQTPLPRWRQVLDRLETADTPEALRMEAVAEHLGLTAITLRRHLAAEGRQFQALATAYQRERAFALAVEEGLSEAALAERLGYAGRVPMARAFHGWFGSSPVALRATLQALQAQGAGPDWVSPLHLPPAPAASGDLQTPVMTEQVTAACDDLIPAMHALGAASQARHGAPALNVGGPGGPVDTAVVALDAERRAHLTAARRWLHGLPEKASIISRPVEPSSVPSSETSSVPFLDVPPGWSWGRRDLPCAPDARTCQHLGTLLQGRVQREAGAATETRRGLDPHALGHLLLAAWRLPPTCLQALAAPVPC